MTGKPQAKIISCNKNGSEVCASAARISTTQGDANEIFEKAQGNPKNHDLIQKVLRSGHKSVIEHAVFTVAFWNVSACVEQYVIESRLASFTVKSRRYVDFSNFGYYVPEDLAGEDLAAYRAYMDMLFEAYGALLEAGVPKEDARFLLPYSFHSNFYCTLNARELVHIIASIWSGRGREYPELLDLADQLAEQLRAEFPSLAPELERPSAREVPTVSSEVFRLGPAPTFLEEGEAGGVKLISAPQDPIGMLRAAYQVGCPDTDKPFGVEELLRSERPRELEQLSYSFLISDITLSGITHLVRHRMQSIMIPPVQSVDHSRYILPATIKENPAALERYRSVLTAAYGMLGRISRNPALRKYSCYFAVSGNVMDVMTTLNARELMLILRLRTCNRAQWEIRQIAIEMLRQLRQHCPELYDKFGPSCYLYGRCPEGRMTCGQMAQIAETFGGKL